MLLTMNKEKIIDYNVSTNGNGIPPFIYSLSI